MRCFIGRRVYWRKAYGTYSFSDNYMRSDLHITAKMNAAKLAKFRFCLRKQEGLIALTFHTQYRRVMLLII